MVSHHWVGPHGMRAKIPQQILKDGRLEADRVLSFAESGLDGTGVLISSRGWLSPSVCRHSASDSNESSELPASRPEHMA